MTFELHEKHAHCVYFASVVACTDADGSVQFLILFGNLYRGH